VAVFQRRDYLGFRFTGQVEIDSQWISGEYATEYTKDRTGESSGSDYSVSIYF
jgi:hypothetical protein